MVLNANYEKYVGYKVMLYPTQEQIHLFNEYFNVSAFVYNLGIQIEEIQKCSNEEKKFLKFYDLSENVNYLKNNDPNYLWLQRYDSTTIKLILQDVVYAYSMFFEKKCNYPVYKDIRYCNKQFPIRSERLSIDENYIRIPSIGYAFYYNTYGNQIIGNGDKYNKNSRYLHYIDTRISFDGLNFYLSFSLPKDNDHNINSYQYYGGNPEWQEQKCSEAIGIDVGLRNEKWLVDSTGKTVERPDSDPVRKKIARLNRKLDRQYKMNKKRGIINNANLETKNMKKTKEQIEKCNQKIRNRRRNEVYNYANELLDKKPKAVVMESIETKNFNINNEEKQCNFQKNHKNAQILDAALYESMHIIQRKMEANGIPVIYADPQYPSSQICSRCGYKQDIRRSKYYRCPNCGLVINRDINAAINLANIVNKD